MGFSNGTPTIPTDGLVFAVDAGNGQSYVSGSTDTFSLVSSETGSLTNGVGFSSSNQGSWDFDGVNDYVNIDGVQASLSLTTTGTWSCWVKPVDSTPAAKEVFISFGDTSANSNIEFYVTGSGKLEAKALKTSNVKWTVTDDNTSFSDDTWTHIAITHDATAPKIYVDGVLVDTGGGAGANYWFSIITLIDNGRIGDLKFGGSSDSNHFNGNMSNVQIYNKALTATEILQTYNATKNRFI